MILDSSVFAAGFLTGIGVAVFVFWVLLCYLILNEGTKEEKESRRIYEEKMTWYRNRYILDLPDEQNPLPESLSNLKPNKKTK